MANSFLQLHAPAADGAGTAVDVSGLASLKTVVVAGSWRLTPNITIEINNDPAAGGGWAPLETIQGAGMLSFGIVAYWMRARVSNFRGGQAPEIWVGAATDSPDFDSLVAPAGSGAGAAVDVSAMGPYKSVQVSGAYQGSTIIEVSEDGGTTWGTAFSFPSGQAGVQSSLIVAEFMRVKRSGVPTLAAGLPVVKIGAGGAPAGGGGPAVVETTASDPTQGAGVEGEPNQLLVRTDELTLYYKSGPADTDWTQVASSVATTSSDPTQGAGVSGLLDQLLVRTDTGSIYVKDGAGNTDWTQVSYGGSVVSYLTSVGSAFYFGPGLDGDIVFDGSSTVLGFVPVGGVYTLTRTIVPRNMTVNAGVEVKTGGAPIFVRGLLSGSGKITRNGLPGTPVTGAGGAALAAGVLPGSGAGGNGTNNNGGNASASQNNAPHGFTVGTAAGGPAGQPGANGGIGGGGGGGGSDNSETGGTGGTIAQSGAFNDTYIPHCLFMGRNVLGTLFTCGSGGGGGAGGSGGGNPGGGGGSGAGWVVITCGRSEFTGSIEAKGGDGGPPHPSQTTGAGGGGGGGGFVVFVAGTGAMPTINVSGGVGANGQGAGQRGGDGGAGLVNAWVLG